MPDSSIFPEPASFQDLRLLYPYYEIVLTPAATGIRFFTSTDPGSYVTAHWHRAIEIIYVQKGSLSVTVESHTRELSAGGCTLINANVIHSTKCTTPNTAIVFQIPLDFAQTYIPNVNALVFHINDTTMDQKEMTKISIFKNTLGKNAGCQRSSAGRIFTGV